MHRCLKRLLSVNVAALVPNVFFPKAYATDETSAEASSGEFGTLFKWRTVASGFLEAKETRRPIMVLVHRSGCPTCSKLRPQFATSVQLHDLSNHFVMINIDSERERIPKEFTPDGAYIPRILFFAPDGAFLENVANEDPERAPDTKYYYWNIGQIIASMSRVVDMFPHPVNAH